MRELYQTDPEARRRDEQTRLLLGLGDVIAQGRFQEGGIAGGVSRLGTGLMDMRREEEDREREFAIRMAELDTEAQSALLEGRRRILEIENQRIRGEISDQDAADAVSLEILKMEADQAVQGQDVQDLIALLGLRIQASAAQASAQRQLREMPDELSAYLLDRTGGEGTIGGIPDLNTPDGLEVLEDKGLERILGEINRVRDTIRVLSGGNQSALDDAMRLFERELARKGYTTGTGLREEGLDRENPDIVLGGNADGGSIDLSFNKLVPQP